MLLSLVTIAVSLKSEAAESVVLLHGLARTESSMKKMEQAFIDHGYYVLNIDYPSRKYPIEELAVKIRDEVENKTEGYGKIHFITHSMGGIILRYIQKNMPLARLGRVVMLSPPNHGSKVVDKLHDDPFFEWINGPAGKQLLTDERGIWNNLGRADFELGIITGDRSINWINSLMIPGKDDGKVSVESAAMEGMKDFLVVHTSHPFIMKNKIVIEQCLHFIENGHFKRD